LRAGDTVRATRYTTVNDTGCSTTKSALTNADAWVSTKYKSLAKGVFFEPNKLGGTGNGTIAVRKVGTTGAWTTEAVSNWSVNLDGFTAGVAYDFVVDTGGTNRYHGTFTPDANGTPV